MKTSLSQSTVLEVHLHTRTWVIVSWEFFTIFHISWHITPHDLRHTCPCRHLNVKSRTWELILTVLHLQEFRCKSTSSPSVVSTVSNSPRFLSRLEHPHHLLSPHRRLSVPLYFRLHHITSPRFTVSPGRHDTWEVGLQDIFRFLLRRNHTELIRQKWFGRKPFEK
jgi:hypothetical protein